MADIKVSGLPATTTVGTGDLVVVVQGGTTKKATVAQVVANAPTSSGGGSSYTDEQARDAAAALFTNGTHTGVTFAYDDNGDRINATVISSGGGGGSGRTYALDTRDFGAKWDGSTDDSAAWQATIDALPAGGGVIICPDGVSIATGIRIRSGISIKGVGGNRNAFNQTGGRGTVISHPPAPPTSQIVPRIAITNGGTGYTSAPTVSFSGGGGSGLSALAYVSGGKVTALRVINSGTGYTSAPTVTFSGGGGSGAAATAVRTSVMFYYPSDSYSDAISFSDLTLVGQNTFHTIGIWIGHSWFTRITKVDTYFFPAEAIWIRQGGGPHVTDCKIFGNDRQINSTLYGSTIENDPSGSLRFGSDCSDVVVNAVEVGSGRSNDQVNLPNAAIYYEGTAGNFSGVVAEGGDVGIRLSGVNSRWVNARADINYGHGWYLVRDLGGNQPPLNNWIANCWGHNNSKYASAQYDNFYVGPDAINNRFNGIFSDATGSPTHRYGFNNTSATGTRLYFWDDFGAGTAALNNITPTV